ncbi:MAG: TM2 domain-containing protein [Nitrospinae bacterium]|nr:TM2 domain-containing protein [Nitrospinota bacterium]
MANQGERLIALKSGLDARELHILNIELDRRRKSTGVTYALWFFMSWLGLHKFYLGRIATGVVYVVAPWILILVFLVGFVMAESNPEAGGATAVLSGLALIVYGLWWFVDLFTIPRQVNACNENLELEIIASLNARKQRPGLTPNPTRPE